MHRRVYLACILASGFLGGRAYAAPPQDVAPAKSDVVGGAEMNPAAAPQTPLPQAPALITKPRLRLRPTAEDMVRYFPDLALRKGLDGRVTVRCIVTVKGDLANCDVQSESPPDMGFGQATKKLVRMFSLEPMDKDGIAVAGRPYQFSITWTGPR